MKDLCSELSSLSLSKRVMLERVLLQERATLAGLEAIRPRQRASIPLSFAQERLWFLDQLAAGNPFYNINSAVRLIGALVEPALRESLWEMVRRHEVLRTRFGVVAELAVQEVEAELKLELPVVDLRFLAATEREDVARQISEQQAGQAFDLARLPLLRAVLVRLRNEEHWFVCTMHHIISDGWSMAVFVREVARLYEAFVAGEASPLERLPIQYGDYAEWQREWLKGGVLTEQLRYWKEQLAGAPTVLELPTDRMRRGVQSYRGSSERVELSKELRLSLEELGRREGVTLFMTLLAAWQVLLQRYTNQEQIVVGTPIAGRTRREVEGLIGFFANTLVLRTDLGGDPSFRELLKRVREVCLGAYSNQDLPFEKLVEELQPERTLSHNPLFQVFFNMFRLATDQLEFPGLTTELLLTPELGAKFDLTLYVIEQSGESRFEIAYNSSLFDSERIVEMLEQLNHLLRQIVQKPDETIARFSLITDRSKALLHDPAQTLCATWTCAVQTLVAEQATRTSDRCAVTDPETTLTYGELDRLSNQLANYSLANGVGYKDVVAVYANRSASLIWALLGIVKAGAAFMILDPANPTSYLIDCLRSAHPRGWLQLVAGPLPEGLDEVAKEETASVSLTLVGPYSQAIGFLSAYSAEIPQVDTGPHDLAYVGFTSGSMGNPKAIGGEHRPISHFFQWQARTFGLHSGDRFSMLS